MEIESNAHHLVLGQLNDFLTGQVLADTHDERYRQQIAKKLVMNKGHKKENIKSNITLQVNAGEKIATLKIDFLVECHGTLLLMVKYAPGSLVTRRLSTLALSRIIKPYQIPRVVITNGEDAEIMDGYTGCVIGTGFNSLPDKNELEMLKETFSYEKIDGVLFEKASRIAYACEVDGSCPCDTDVCVIDN